jgi:hypothetical protein
MTIKKRDDRNKRVERRLALMLVAATISGACMCAVGEATGAPAVFIALLAAFDRAWTHWH